MSSHIGTLTSHAFAPMLDRTTVGYGDITPVTPLGRLFTAFACIFSITFVISSLMPVLQWLLLRQRLAARMGAGAQIRN